MKIERHLCDMCGGTIRKGERFATLSVPEFDKPAEKAHADPYTFTFISIISGAAESSSKNYEVCRGCVDGLLKARTYIRRAALERVYQMEEA